MPKQWNFVEAVEEFKKMVAKNGEGKGEGPK
jgi:hypothetical protein